MDDVIRDVMDLSDFAFDRLTSRIADLDDDEYWWEPAPGAWSLRPSGDGGGDGDGKLRLEFTPLFDEEPPVTTIAWRLTHIIDLLSEERCATWIGLEPEPENLFEDGAPASADQARQLLSAAGARWRRYVTAADPSALMQKLGPIGRQFADATRLAFILHIVDELVHHGAEVALLRDLHRARQPRDPVVAVLLLGDDAAVAALGQETLEAARAAHPHLVLTAAATARWDAIPRLLDLGFGMDGRNGRTPLHHAAAGGHVPTIHLLRQRGADLSARDDVYQATPAEWALFFGQADAAAALA